MQFTEGNMKNGQNGRFDTWKREARGIVEKSLCLW